MFDDDLNRTVGAVAEGLRPGHGFHQSSSSLLRAAQPMRRGGRHVLRALVIKTRSIIMQTNDRQ